MLRFRERYQYSVVENDEFYNPQAEAESFWKDEDEADYERQTYSRDYSWVIAAGSGCYSRGYGKDKYVMGLTFDLYAYCGTPLSWHYIDSVSYGDFPSDAVNCDFEEGPFVKTGPEAADWFEERKAYYESQQDCGVHIMSPELWDDFIADLNNHPCHYYAVGATKDNHVNNWSSLYFPWLVDVLDGYGHYTPQTVAIPFGYLMAIDESPLYYNETFPWVSANCSGTNWPCDGSWEDELVFGCTNLTSTACADPPPQGIRLRAWDDLGNWKRSANLYEDPPANEYDIIYSHPNEGTYKRFNWNEEYTAGTWGGGDVFQQYVNYPNDFVNLGNHKGADIPIHYDISPKLAGTEVVIYGLLDPPMDNTLDDQPTNPGAYHDYENAIRDNYPDTHTTLEITGCHEGEVSVVDPYIEGLPLTPLCTHVVTGPSDPLPQITIHTSRYGGDNYQVLIEVRPCLCNDPSEAYFEASPVMNVWRKGEVDTYSMQYENSVYSPDASEAPGAFDDTFWELDAVDCGETYWMGEIPVAMEGILLYCDKQDENDNDYVPFHEPWAAFDSPNYHIHIQGIYAFYEFATDYMGITWLDFSAPDLGACIHRHGLVSTYAIRFYSDENYSFEEILRHVTTHEIGRNLGLIWDCSSLANCVMAPWSGLAWPREKPYLCLNCIAAARESANRFLKADCY